MVVGSTQRSPMPSAIMSVERSLPRSDSIKGLMAQAKTYCGPMNAIPEQNKKRRRLLVCFTHQEWRSFWRNGLLVDPNGLHAKPSTTVVDFMSPFCFPWFLVVILCDLYWIFFMSWLKSLSFGMDGSARRPKPGDG